MDYGFGWQQYVYVSSTVGVLEIFTVHIFKSKWFSMVPFDTHSVRMQVSGQFQ
jgi:hypothetical protein